MNRGRFLMVCDFRMSIYKNRLPSWSIGLNYATWRDEYTRRFFHGGNDTARQFIKFHTRPMTRRVIDRYGRPGRSRVQIRRRLCAEHARDVFFFFFFYGSKIAAGVRRPLRSTENNFLIRENGLKSADEIEFIVPLARLSCEISFFFFPRDIRSIFCYRVIP